MSMLSIQEEAMAMHIHMAPGEKIYADMHHGNYS